MFENVCVGGLRNGKEVEGPHASGGVKIARQPEVMPVLCPQWTLGGINGKRLPHPFRDLSGIVIHRDCPPFSACRKIPPNPPPARSVVPRTTGSSPTPVHSFAAHRYSPLLCPQRN